MRIFSYIDIHKWFKQPQPYKAHFKNGEFHRKKGPAIRWEDGSEAYMIHGKLHRIDGPAIVNMRGNGNNEYWINGKHMSKEEFDMYNFVKDS